MTPARILVTGSREWRDPLAIADALTDALAVVGRRRAVLVHGGQMSRDPVTGVRYGADFLADRTWRDWIGVQARGRFLLVPEVHPADWRRHGRAAGMLRNRVMVDLGADVCLAFPIGRSPGTRGCMNLARMAGIPVIVHEGTPPDPERDQRGDGQLDLLTP